MPPENDPNSPNNSSYSQIPTESPAPAPEPQSPAPSLRDTIEQAYDNPDDTSAGQEARPRDSYGRFAPKSAEPGEAEPKAPSPVKPIIEGQARQPEPAPQGSSTQVPEHWSAEVKADFAKLPPEGQAILLNRHREMEADYTRKTQAMSGAVNFTQSLAPVFNDPVVNQSLRQMGLNASQAIHQWGSDIRQAASPNLQDRINLLVDITQRMGLDPARLFVSNNQPPPQISKEDWNDPAVRYFADHLGRTSSEIQSLRNDLQQMRQIEAQQREQESLQATRWGIDQYADEKGPSGQPLRPYFDKALPMIIELFKADPERDLQDAYDRACWADPEIRQLMLTAERQQAQNQNSVNHAKAAMRSNTRGLTSPVAKPTAKTGNGSLRDIINASADEIGL